MAERILVLRLSSLGDVVLTSTFLRALHDVFPAANVDFVVREDLAPIATALPHVSRVVAVTRGLALPALLDLAAGFARHGYAHVFDLHQSLRSRLLTSRIENVV